MELAPVALMRKWFDRVRSTQWTSLRENERIEET